MTDDTPSRALLTGELVRLAAPERDDIPIYAKWFSDVDLMRYLWMQAIYPQNEEAETRWFDNLKDSRDVTFGIRTLDGDTLIGNCGLHRIDKRNRSAAFGIAIGEREYWGRGYGTDALRVILHYAFTELNLRRIELWTFAWNKRAIRSYEKAGFTHEGTRRQAVYRDGRYNDVWLMAILRDEWAG